MTSIVIMVVVAAITMGVAIAAQKLSPRTPTAALAEPPTALHRGDFRSPETPWLIAVFTSATCSSCAAVLAEMRGHESADIVVEEIEVSRAPDLHRKYHIDSVPTTVVARPDGDARLAFVGPIGPDHRNALAATLRVDAD